MWQNFVQYPFFFFFFNSTKILQSHDLVFVNPFGLDALYGVPPHILTRINELSGKKKTNSPMQKNIHQRKFQKTTLHKFTLDVSKTMYKILHQGNGVSHLRRYTSSYTCSIMTMFQSEK